jgi:hypothetical protein
MNSVLYLYFNICISTLLSLRYMLFPRRRILLQQPLGWLQVPSFGKNRPTVSLDVVHHSMLWLGGRRRRPDQIRELLQQLPNPRVNRASTGSSGSSEALAPLSWPKNTHGRHLCRRLPDCAERGRGPKLLKMRGLPASQKISKNLNLLLGTAHQLAKMRTFIPNH